MDAAPLTLDEAHVMFPVEEIDAIASEPEMDTSPVAVKILPVTGAVPMPTNPDELMVNLSVLDGALIVPVVVPKAIPPLFAAPL